MRFRIRRGDVEIEFEGEPSDALKRYDELMSWVRSAPEGKAKSTIPSDSKEDKQVARRNTGESKVIRERLDSLKDEGFFKSPKGLAEVRKEMQTRGWYHESWNIQPVLLRQGRELGIRRIQDKGGYKYVEL